MAGTEEPKEEPEARGTSRGETRWVVVAVAVLVTVAAVTPAFAAGALAEPIAGELKVSMSIFGFALAGFFAFTALGSPLSARLVERIGAGLQLALAAACSGALMVGFGSVSSAVTLAALLAAGGLVNSMVGPAAGRVLGSEVSPGRLSLASGLVQAALAVPPLPAGVLVRFVAEPHGWRAALWMGGALVTLAALVPVLVRQGETGNARHHEAGAEAEPPETAGNRVLFLWASGAALGTVGVTATATFFVSIGTSSGFSAATAGLLASAAGGLAAFVRVGAGVLADRRPRANVAAVVGMMLLGSIGLAVLSLGTPVAFLAGAPIVVAGLWGWNGLLVASAVRLLPGSPARALGGLQVGFFSGATAAPLVFGALGAAVGVGGALLAAAACAVAAAAAVTIGELHRRRTEPGRAGGSA